MWIFTSDEFLSVVRHRDKPDSLMIRYRSREQAEACTLPGDVSITQLADYIARKTVKETDFVDWMINKTASLQYDNYKNSTADTLMHKAPLMRVWDTMYQWQNESEYGDEFHASHPSSAYWHDYADDKETVFCENCWEFHGPDQACKQREGVE